MSLTKLNTLSDVVEIFRYKTNILKLNHLDDKTIELKIFELNSENNEIIQENIRKIVSNLQDKNRQTIIFQHQYAISSNKDIRKQIQEEIDNLDGKPLLDFSVKEVKISLENSKKDDDIKNLFLHYIGVLISHTLKNRNEKILVYEEYGNRNIFRVTLSSRHKKFGIISVFKGFRYKPILYENSCAVIVNHRCKYFTEDTLRTYERDLRDDIEFERGIEQLCPISNCSFRLTPFTKCFYGNPRYMGSVSDFIVEDLKPSDCDPNIIEYFQNPEKCTTGELGKLIKKHNRLPVVGKYFYNRKDPYHYPLELLRIIPINDDAGSDSKELSEETHPSPKERFTLIKDYKERYLYCVNNLDFPIIPDDYIELDSQDVNYMYFENPKHKVSKRSKMSEIETIEITELPKIALENDKKLDFYKRKEKFDHINFNIIYSGRKPVFSTLKPILKDPDPEKNSRFEKFARVKIKDINYYNVRDKTKIEKLIKEYKKNSFDFFIIIYDFENKDVLKLKSELIANDIPNQSLRYSTIRKRGYSIFYDSIYYQIINKIGCQTWGLSLSDIKVENILAISLRYGKNRMYSSILSFRIDGGFEEGYFIDENKNEFNSVFGKILEKIVDDKDEILLMINGLVTNELNEILEKNLDKKTYAIYDISKYSLLRLFTLNRTNEVSDRRVFAGHGVIIEGSLNLVSYEGFVHGTQTCIKITERTSTYQSEKNFYKLIFELTQYNPSFSRNSTKLPYPIHSSSETLKKSIRLNLKTFYFSVPYYF